MVLAAHFGLTAAHGAIAVLNTDYAATNSTHNTSKPDPSGDFGYSSGIYTYSYSAGANSDMLVIGLSAEKSGEALSITYGGAALTEAVSSGAGSGASIWYLPNPAESGTITIDASLVATMNGFGLGIASLQDTGGLGVGLHTVGSSTSSTDVGITTTVADSFVMVSADANTTTGSVSMSSPLVTIGTTVDVGSSQAGMGYENLVGAGSSTYSWSPNGSERGMVAASFVSVPEPTSAVLVAGFGALALFRRRRGC